jgi:hypothetical protein
MLIIASQHSQLIRENFIKSLKSLHASLTQRANGTSARAVDHCGIIMPFYDVGDGSILYLANSTISGRRRNRIELPSTQVGNQNVVR